MSMPEVTNGQDSTAFGTPTPSSVDSGSTGAVPVDTSAAGAGTTGASPSPPPTDAGEPVPTGLPTSSPLTGVDYGQATTDAIHARVLDVEAALVQMIAHVGINLDYAALPSAVAGSDQAKG